MNDPGIESRLGARFSAPVQTGPGAHPASYTMGTGSFPKVKRPGRGVALTTHPYLAPRLKKEYRYTSTPLWAFVASSRVTFTFPLNTIIHVCYNMHETFYFCFRNAETWLKNKKTTCSGLPLPTVFIFLAQRLPTRAPQNIVTFSAINCEINIKQCLNK